MDKRRGAIEYPGDLCLHHIVEARSSQEPDAIAAVHGDHELTYGQLNRKANQLAWHLLELGVGPEAGVAICLKPSFDMLVAFLAVLKAGAACVPLDPKYPAERLRFMLKDTQAPVLLTEEAFIDSFSDIVP